VRHRQLTKLDQEIEIAEIFYEFRDPEPPHNGVAQAKLRRVILFLRRGLQILRAPVKFFRKAVF
jgi:hypothetical protein